MEHSKSFQKYYNRYQSGGCIKDPLGAIYDWEYQEITGEPYEA